MIEIYEDIEFTVEYSHTEGAAWVDFKAYEIIGHESDDEKNHDIPVYEGIGGRSADDKATRDITQANSLLEGTVKWDGCCHFNFGDQGYIHLCGDRSVKNICALVKRAYCRSGEIGDFHYQHNICK